jgi:hypothetical protein
MEILLTVSKTDLQTVESLLQSIGRVNWIDFFYESFSPITT